MRRLFEEFRITKNHYKTTLKQYWKFLFIKKDVLQFKVIIFHRSPIKFFIQNSCNASSVVKGRELKVPEETNGDN